MSQVCCPDAMVMVTVAMVIVTVAMVIAVAAAGSDRILVFVETKRNADFLASFLSQEGFPTTSIHG